MVKKSNFYIEKKRNFIPGIPKEMHSHSQGMGNFGNDACFEIFHSHSHYSREFGEWEWEFPGTFHSPHISDCKM